MKQLLYPKSVAVIGVSHEPTKIGFIVFDNLLNSFKGKVFGINPNSEPVLGRPLYKTVLDVEEKIDMVVICVPAELVPKVLESCGKKRIAVAIVISAGFSESGEGGKALEKEAIEIAKKYDIRILGPNCLGVINNFDGLNASFAASKLPAKYRVGIFSQSGAMGAAMLDFANGSGFGFSYFVSLGNKSDISETDLISDWIEDDNVKVALGYLEDVKNGPEFLEVAQKFTAKKPLILLKGGTTKEGSGAAHLHTAALAGDSVVFEAAIKEAGVIIARNLGDLFELAVAFSENGLPRGKKLAIVSNAGGPSVLAADACGNEKVELASLNPKSINDLATKTRAASLSNPIDLRGDATSKEFGEALNILENDRQVDAILVIVTPQAMTELENIAWEAVSAKRTGKKPIYINFIGGELVEKAKDICSENGLATFSYPERAVRAFRYQTEFEAQKIRLAQKPKKHPKHKIARSIINFSERGINPERLAALLSVYGVPMAKTLVVKNPKEAAAALKQIKPPVVMKILSPDILHKTDVGGVMLGIETEEEAKKAFKKIVTNVKKRKPNAQIDGITVMQTAKEGLELIVGAKKDPVFGPVLVFGFGGIFVELVSDFVTAVGPFDEVKIRQMISETKVVKIIRGYRGENGYSERALIQAMLAVAALISDHPEIAQIEINPLVLEEKGGALGLDAKIELTGSVLK